MAIQQINPSADDDDLDEVIDDEGTYFSPRVLLDEITKLEDCIITMPESEFEKFKKNLSKRKARDIAKMKAAGVPPDTRVLSYMPYPAKDAAGQVRPGIIDVRCKLAERRNINVLSIRKPDDEF